MKQDWIIRLELSRFFDKHKEIRVRVRKGLLKDRILFGVFESTIKKEFPPEEIKKGIKLGLLYPDQIAVGGTVRRVFGWTEEECQYQPVWHKRVLASIKSFLERKGLI